MNTVGFEDVVRLIAMTIQQLLLLLLVESEPALTGRTLAVRAAFQRWVRRSNQQEWMGFPLLSGFLSFLLLQRCNSSSEKMRNVMFGGQRLWQPARVQQSDNATADSPLRRPPLAWGAGPGGAAHCFSWKHQRVPWETSAWDRPVGENQRHPSHRKRCQHFLSAFLSS